MRPLGDLMIGPMRFEWCCIGMMQWKPVQGVQAWFAGCLKVAEGNAADPTADPASFWKPRTASSLVDLMLIGTLMAQLHGRTPVQLLHLLSLTAVIPAQHPDIGTAMSGNGHYCMQLQGAVDPSKKASKGASSVAGVLQSCCVSASHLRCWGHLQNRAPVETLHQSGLAEN